MQLFKQMLPSAALAAAVAMALLFVLARWWKSASRCAGAVALGAVGLTCTLNLIERGPFGPATLFAVTTVLCTGTCIALMLSGSLLLGQLAGVLAAIAAACSLLIIAVTVPFPPGGAAAPLSL